MTRERNRIGVAMLTLIVGATMNGESIAQSAPSVPNLIAYQGRVTLSGGGPVADGSYPATFTIYNFSSGGASLWSENTNVTTNGGTFSHNLGSATSLPSTLTIANDSLWLSIVFNGELLSPRTRMVGNAFSLTANHLEMNNGFGSVALRTNPVDHSLSQYGPGNEEQIRLGGQIWPSLIIDGGVIDGTTDDIVLSTNSGGGSLLQLRKPGGAAGVVLYSGGAGAPGTLTLADGAGAPSVYIDAGATGDGAVQLPSSSVSALEIFDEPGIAAFVDSTFLLVSAPFTNIASRTITVPKSGYVVAIASIDASLISQTGTLEAAISTNPASFLSPAYKQHADSNLSRHTISIHEAITVTAGAHTFYLQVNPFSSSWRVLTMSLTLMYFPTGYGTVTLAGADSGRNPIFPALKSIEQIDADEAPKRRFEEEVRELRAQAREMARRLEELEATMPRQIPVSAIDNPEK